MKQYYVYILTNKPYGTLYVGVTGDLIKRISQHRYDLVEGFTKNHGLHRLVYYEICEDIHQTILREKRLKKWNREWKLKLIREMNPQWEDLYAEIAGRIGPPPSRG
jgi:putative endonuclease